ncbi:hypothetical protein EI77_03637 [Prosthecobacter fusiformis]|uniref:Uncharacterized protein n=1 Tax=Prosthecobacter fusiformis TaxID=48464 RepID=A0A4R7RMI6_9BACT|nr:hypothetical protein EI77_03637 [Prosthecobacter fusiformis]
MGIEWGFFPQAGKRVEWWRAEILRCPNIGYPAGGGKGGETDFTKAEVFFWRRGLTTAAEKAESDPGEDQGGASWLRDGDDEVSRGEKL